MGNAILRPFIRLLSIVGVLALAASAQAVEQIDIDTHRDPRFLPYALDTIQFLEKRPYDIPVRHSCRVIDPALEGVSDGLFVQTWNSFAPGSSAQVGFRTCLDPVPIISDNGLWMTILDQVAFVDTTSGIEGIIAFGLRNDSLFAARVSMDAERSTIFLATGDDRTGDSVWSGEVWLVRGGDFDQDGHPELLVWNSALRDLGPRLLFCIQVDPFRVDWSLPCASRIDFVELLPATDNSPARFLAAAQAPANGWADALFSDEFCYLFGVSLTGKVLFHKIIGRYPQWMYLLHLPETNATYLVHTRDFRADTTGGDSEYVQGYHLSEIDRDGDPIRSVPLDGGGNTLWAADYTGDGFPEVNFMYSDGSIAVYDTALTLLARSGPTDLHVRMSQLTGWGEEGTVQVMSTSRGTEIYSNRFRKLAALNAAYHYVEPMAYDSSGALQEIHGTNFQGVYFLHPRKVGLLGHASIIYVDYQPYILSVLFGLVVGIVTVNHYRRRTRSNLTVIAEQKDELEETHAALEAAHTALKEAQQKIIAQEKYRQARDIAGGFAHEIRNALFPARASVERARDHVADEAGTASLANINRAVDRAINMTRLITEYTQIEDECRPEKTDLSEVIRRAVDDNKVRSDATGVQIRVDAQPSPPVMANLDQVVIVMNNLIRNSLDALESTVDPRIEISLRTVGDEVEVEIRDNGPGVPESDRERIFDMFYSTRPRTGTGVGLALSRKLVSLYDGRLTCEPSDIGARFVLKLPPAGSDA